jgi:hypothetical protein
MAGANPPIPITPAKLATRAVTGYPTALRWLKIHHPRITGAQARRGSGNRTQRQICPQLDAPALGQWSSNSALL